MQLGWAKLVAKPSVCTWDLPLLFLWQLDVSQLVKYVVRLQWLP